MRFLFAGVALILCYVVWAFTVGGWSMDGSALNFDTREPWRAATGAVMAVFSGGAVTLTMAAIKTRIDRRAAIVGVACAAIAFALLPRVHDAWLRRTIVGACDDGEISACERAVAYGGTAAKIADDRIFDASRTSAVAIDGYLARFPRGEHSSAATSLRDGLYAAAIAKLEGPALAKRLLEAARASNSSVVSVNFQRPAGAASGELMLQPELAEPLERSAAASIGDAFTAVVGDGLLSFERNAGGTGATLDVAYEAKPSGREYVNEYGGKYQALLFSWRLSSGDAPAIELSSEPKGASYSYQQLADVELLRGAFDDLRRQLIVRLRRADTP